MTPYQTYKKNVKPGAGQHLAFAAGKGYYPAAGAPKPRVQPVSTDPFAPMSGPQIQQTVDRYTGMYGTPLTDPQIQARAQGEIDPLIQQIADAINSRTKLSTAAIQQGSDALAKALAATDYGAPYAAPIQQQAAVDSALQQSLSGGGTQLAQDLSARLGQIGDPAVAQAAAATQQQGAALGNTELARGSSALSNLIANSGALREYGAKQPGIARQQGLQGIAQASQQGISSIADQTGEVLKQLPTILASLRGDNQTLRANRANAAGDLYSTLTGQNITKATAKAGLVTDKAKLAYDRKSAAAAATAKAATTAETVRHNKANETTAAENATTAKARAATAAKAAAAKAKKAKQPKPLSASESRTAAARANTLIEVAFKGGTDSKGNTLDPLDYQAAVAELRNEGMFADPRLSKIAYAALHRWYTTPGERGRPFTGRKPGKAFQKAAGRAFNPLGPLVGGQ